MNCNEKLCTWVHLFQGLNSDAEVDIEAVAYQVQIF